MYRIREVSAETANRLAEPTALCNRNGESVIVGYDTLSKVSTSPAQPLRKQIFKKKVGDKHCKKRRHRQDRCQEQQSDGKANRQYRKAQ